MAGYGDLDTIIGEIRRAAIDTFMADRWYHPHFADNRYYAMWGFAGLRSYTRPDAAGWGGGAASGFASTLHETYENAFDIIRDWVEFHTGKWRGLPDGSIAEAIIPSTTDAAAVFGLSGLTGNVSNSSEISLANGLIETTVTTQMQGSFKTPFLNKYHTQLELVAGGLGASCALLEMNYRAQAEMWPAVRRDAVAICEAARDAFKARSAAAAGEQGKIALTVGVAVLGAFASIATAGAALPAVITLGALSVTATAGLAALEQANAALEGDDYESIMASFGSALEKLNSTIHQQETLLATMLTEAASTIRGDLKQYNLDSYQMPFYDGSSETIEISEDNAELVRSYMWRILDALTLADGRLGSAPDSSPTPRDWQVGIGAEGTHPAAADLYNLVDQCIGLTYSEYYRGKVLFDATVNDYFVADEVTSGIVDQLAAEEAAIAEPTP